MTYMQEKIIYRHRLNRTPTPKDRQKKIGLDGLAKKLAMHGWIDGEETVIREFNLLYEANAQPGNNYIQWTATLRE